MSDDAFTAWLGHVDAGRIGPHLGIAPPATAGDEQPAAPNVRTFSMNSAEGFEALRTPRERMGIPNGSKCSSSVAPHSTHLPWLPAARADLAPFGGVDAEQADFTVADMERRLGDRAARPLAASG